MKNSLKEDVGGWIKVKTYSVRLQCVYYYGDECLYFSGMNYGISKSSHVLETIRGCRGLRYIAC